MIVSTSGPTLASWIITELALGQCKSVPRPRDCHPRETEHAEEPIDQRDCIDCSNSLQDQRHFSGQRRRGERRKQRKPCQHGTTPSNSGARPTRLLSGGTIWRGNHDGEATIDEKAQTRNRGFAVYSHDRS